jgi:iron complex outermembrane receptor protein
VVETDQGGFLMADFDTRLAGVPLRGNAGVRYVQTKQVATGYLATGGGTEVTVEQTTPTCCPR